MLDDIKVVPLPDPFGDDPEGVARSEAARKELYRQQGIAAAQGMANQSLANATGLQTAGNDLLSGIDTATTAGKANIRAQGAEGLAAGAASGGNTGNAYAGALQAGLNSGRAQSNFGGQQALQRGQAELGIQEKVGDARSAAAAQQLEAIKFGKEAGSNAEDKQKKMADYTTRMQQILANNKHWYGDDEAQAQQQIEQMVATEEDPEIKAYFTDQAGRYGRSDPGYDF